MKSRLFSPNLDIDRSIKEQKISERQKKYISFWKQFPKADLLSGKISAELLLPFEKCPTPK
jgi:hypothetical protein